MISYEIRMTEPGKVYVVVTNDDGSTFGQWFSGDEIVSLKSIDAAVDGAVARVSLGRRGFEISPAIIAEIGKPRGRPSQVRP